jgi:hypothetical protein
VNGKEGNGKGFPAITLSIHPKFAFGKFIAMTGKKYSILSRIGGFI